MKPFVPWARAFLLLLCGLAGFFLAARIMPHMPLRDGLVPLPIHTPDFKRPGFPHFYTQSNDGQLGQRILYHDIGASISHARKADLMIYGNSRMQLGLRGDFLAPRAEAAGLKAFALGCGHAERIRFAIELIRRHDLRPKVFVLSGDPDIYTEGVTEVGQRAMDSTQWEARRSFLEAQGSWAATSRLHAFLPKLELIEQSWPMFIVYRSPRNGWWRTVLEMNYDFPVHHTEELPSYEHLLPLARELHEEISSRGGLLVLTTVPDAAFRTGHLPMLAERLDVPYILPPYDGLLTADRWHLNRDSAAIYSEAFWDLFIADPRVRERLQLGDP